MNATPTTQAGSDQAVIMPLREGLVPSIGAIVDEALALGFRVFVPTDPDRPGVMGQVGEVAYLCKDIDGSFVVAGAHNLFGFEPLLRAPIKPHRVYGSQGGVKPENNLSDQMEEITAICDSPTVNLGTQTASEVVLPNYGKGCLRVEWHKGSGSFAELTVDGREIPVVF